MINSSHVEGVKAEIRASLEAHGDVRTRLPVALANLDRLLATPRPDAMVRAFCLVVSALLLHERHGGLTTARTDQLGETARDLLVLLDRAVESTALRHLEAELELTLSQVYRRLGRHWLAAWQLAEAEGRVGREGALAAVTALAAANRRLRLGFAPEAIRSLNALLPRPLGPRERQQVVLARMQALRLAGRYAEAAAARSEATGLDSRGSREVAWEGLCAAAQERGRLAPLIAAVQPRKTHRAAAYLTESYLWAAASGEPRFLDRLPKPSSMVQYDDLGVRQTGFLFRCLEALERCHDASVPLLLRRASLARVLERRRFLATVDKELLLLGATWRWLRRTRASALADLVYAEYRQLCSRLTDTTNLDLLGLQ